MSTDTDSPTLLGDLCSLYIDMPPELSGITAGDWIVTAAGSRYLIQQYGEVAQGMVLFVDPPYLGSSRSGRNYLVEMSSVAEHRNLAEALNSAKATVILSGYDSPLYDELYEGWHRVSFAATTNGSPTGERARRTEVVWSNRPTGQPTLFDDLA